MKRIFTAIMLVMALLCFTNFAEAKTTKGKKTKTTTTKSSPIKFDEEGVPILAGHTYSINDGYVKSTFTFYKDYVQVKGSEGGKVVLNEKCDYNTQGDSFYIYAPGYPDIPMFEGQINYDGKYLILNTGFALELVR